MPDFYNPYHFVPATGRVAESATEDLGAIRKGNSTHPARHDRWVSGTYSGRVICRLTLERPTLVGGKQEPEDRVQTKTVTPYMRSVVDADGEQQTWPAIPGSSLRGLISAVAETLSQSTLRVLTETSYSVRVKPGNGLSALGYLVESKAAGRRFDLVPVGLPTLETTGDTFGFTDDRSKWFPVFRDYTWHQVLTAYVDGYDKGPRGVVLRHDSHLDRLKPTSGSPHDDPPTWWYALVGSHPQLYKTIGSLSELPRDLVHGPDRNHATRRNNPRPALHVVRGKRVDRYFLLGRLLDDILPEAKQGAPGRALYTRGTLRVLGIDGRSSQMPRTKKHEIFIPHPLPDAMCREEKPRQPLPVPDSVIETFEAIAAQRKRLSQDGEHPFQLAGRAGGGVARAGELYYFDVDPNGREVTEISISAIWRRSVGDRTSGRVDSAYAFFDSIRDNLTPLRQVAEGEKQRALTPAELLFGVVAEGKDEDAVGADALASRVRVYDGLTLQAPERAPSAITLKTLSTPKPPSPALYFTTKQGDAATAIGKEELNKDRHRPQGRKFYLHHPARVFAATRPTDWACASHDPGENDRMRLRCQPLMPQEENPFYFHMDFDNLSGPELTLLMLALRPDEQFRHKLGLAKSLGLGTVRIEIEGVFLVDRAKRYGRDGLAQPRYVQAWRPAGHTDSPPWRDRWQREADALGSQGTQVDSGSMTDTTWWDDRLVDHRTLEVLRKLGDPAAVRDELVVHTPLTDDQWTGAKSRELETFQWFVENERQTGPNQALRPIEPDQPLPTLRTVPTRSNGGG